MANEQNLIPFDKRSESEVREMNRKGGINSGKTRRRKKTLKDAMNKLLSLDIQSESNKEILKNMGFEEEDMNNQVLIAVAMFNRASIGDVQAARFIADVTGSYAMSDLEKQKMKLEKERLKIEKEKNKPVSNNDIKENMNAIDGIAQQMKEIGDDK